MIFLLIKDSKERDQLASDNFKKLETRLSNTLKETEAELTLPDSPSVAMKLQGDNAIQKARNYQEIKDATGKDNPSGVDITQFNAEKNKATNKQKEERARLTGGKQVKIVKKPDPFTFEEEIDFETWCIQEHDFDVVAERPKHTTAIYALKDRRVGVLYDRLPEWKNAFRVMSKLCHPDTGGNTLAMSMLLDFKELMESLDGIKVVIEYDKKVEELREEYSAPKALK